MAVPLELAVLLTATDSRGFMCRSKWKWPVTFPVALASSQTARQWTASTMSCSSLFLIFSYLMLFPKCRHLLTGRPGTCCVTTYVFFFFFFFFFLSRLKMSTVNSGLLNISRYCWSHRPASHSVSNVCYMLFAECGELLQGLLSNTVSERQGGSGKGHNSRPHHC